MILNHNGVRLRVQVFGQRNNRPPLVLLNGFQVSYEMWLFQIPHFAKNFFVVCYDQRGAGDSGKPSDEAVYSFDNFTDDLRFIVEELKLGTINLMGFAVSCKTAIKYTAKYPKEVAKLVLTSGNPTLIRSAYQAELIAFVQSNYEEAMRSYMRRYFPEPNTDWQHDLLVSIALKSNPHVAVSILKNYYEDDMGSLLPKISVPTLILHGDKNVSWFNTFATPRGLQCMYMPYTTNPHMPVVRRDAVRLVCYRGWSIRKAARHIGVEPSTVSRWVKRDPSGGWIAIPTLSSKPQHHPKELSQEIIQLVLRIRSERNQCAEIIHYRLVKEGVIVSISSVKRILRRYGISRFSKWKKWHQYPPRPMPEKPGLLVEIDSMHEGVPQDRISAYALIDIHSRWAYAEPTLQTNSRLTARFLNTAQQQAPFQFKTIQTDNGSEFSKWFTNIAKHQGINHRHSRVRTPTDNGHVERFIRTLQDECLHKIPKDFTAWKKEIPAFIRYYNTERPHMGLNFKTPLEVLRRY